jgi:hypothetical protein
MDANGHMTSEPVGATLMRIVSERAGPEGGEVQSKSSSSRFELGYTYERLLQYSTLATIRALVGRLDLLFRRTLAFGPLIWVSP